MVRIVNNIAIISVTAYVLFIYLSMFMKETIESTFAVH